MFYFNKVTNFVLFSLYLALNLFKQKIKDKNLYINTIIHNNCN